MQRYTEVLFFTTTPTTSSLRRQGPIQRYQIGDAMPKAGYVYILASRRNGTLYTGVTHDVARRVWEHKHDLIEGFTRQYQVHRLVYYEWHRDIRDAIRREKQIKKWKRAWKIRLIEERNPEWRDLYDELLDALYPPELGGGNSERRQ